MLKLKITLLILTELDTNVIQLQNVLVILNIYLQYNKNEIIKVQCIPPLPRQRHPGASSCPNLSSIQPETAAEVCRAKRCPFAD